MAKIGADEEATEKEKRGWAALEPEHRFLLLILGCTSLFDGFDRGIVQIALPQIRETFGLSQSTMSLWLVGVYVGALPALLITRRADKVGRKQLLMFSIVGYMTATGLTALAPNIETFVACSMRRASPFHWSPGSGTPCARHQYNPAQRARITSPMPIIANRYSGYSIPPGKLTAPDNTSGTDRYKGNDPNTQRVPSENIKISAKVANT